MNMNAIAQTFDTDVLIVGAGPTGLALANVLSQRGVSSVIVDKLASGQNTSRAAVIHAHTLEVLHELGVTRRMETEGLVLSRFTVRDRDRLLIGLDFDRLPSQFSHLLMLPQHTTERILRDVLGEGGRQVRWATTAESLVQSADGVDVVLQTNGGRETIRARYVVGADGVNSLVRRTAGIGFSGSSYEDSFVLADVDMDWEHGRDEVMLFLSPAGLLVVAPLPDGRFRLVATLDGAPEKPGRDDVQALLDTRGPTRGGARVTAVHWSSRFRLQHRVADHYRAGRLFLVGDAAHAHSPAGGQGMNTGLVDAVLLGKLLAEVLAGGREEPLLEQYEALRRPAAQEVLALAGRLTSMATIKGRLARRVRNVFVSFVGSLPPVRRKLQMQLSGWSRRAAANVAHTA
jgi:2-polyprenyl-6-methoxyphenol hydroxylase-like FAD-dependent oxidoreductase